MAIVAKYVDARPGHIAGRLLPKGEGLLHPRSADGNRRGARDDKGETIVLDTIDSTVGL